MYFLYDTLDMHRENITRLSLYHLFLFSFELYQTLKQNQTYQISGLVSDKRGQFLFSHTACSFLAAIYTFPKGKNAAALSYINVLV